jgi:hypothetical protein
VIGGDMDLTLAHVEGALDFRALFIDGSLYLHALRSSFITFDSLKLEDALQQPASGLEDLRRHIRGPGVQMTLTGGDEARPVTTVKGNVGLVGAQVPAGITAEGAQFEGTVTIIGGKIGGLRFTPTVLLRTEQSDETEPDWIPTRIGSLRAVDLRFTRRLHFFGTRFGTRGLSTPSQRPRASLEIRNCFVNGGVYFSDPSIKDDKHSYEEKKWAYAWAGYPNWDSLRSGSRETQRLLKAIEVRRQRATGPNLPALDEIDRDDALATVFAGDVEIVNCELDGDFNFTNAAVAGCLKLTDTVVRADVCAAAFSDEPPQPGRWIRAAHCGSIELEAVTCNGDVDLSGCRIAPAAASSAASAQQRSLNARRAQIDGELRLAVADNHLYGRHDEEGLRCFFGASRLDLTDAKCGRLILPPADRVKRLADDTKLDGLATSEYAAEVVGRKAHDDDCYEAVAALFERADFSPQLYLSYERLLVDAGRVEAANDIYRRMRKRQWLADTHPRHAPASTAFWSVWRGFLLWLSQCAYRLVYGGLLGFGTYVWRPFLFWLLTLAIAVWAIWTPDRLQPSAQRLAAAEVSGPVNLANARDLCPGDWGAADRLWLALRHAMPVVDLLETGDWEPREVARSAPAEPCARSVIVGAPEPFSGSGKLGVSATPKDVLAVIRLINWVLLPVYVIGIAGRIQRRRS